MAKRVGEGLLDESIDREACPLAKVRQPLGRRQFERDGGLGFPPLPDENPQRLDEAGFFERRRSQSSQNTPIMTLQRLDLVAYRSRRDDLACISAGEQPRRQYRRRSTEGEKVRSKLIVQLARDRLALLVLRVEQPLDQLAIGGSEFR